MGMDTKQCSRCGETKELDQFSPQKETRDGRKGVCKPCRASQAKEAGRLAGAQARPCYQDTDTHKECRGCRVMKDRAEFRRNSQKRDGKDTHCRACRAAPSRWIDSARTKQCRRCLAVKDREMFTVDRQKRDGRHSMCKTCLAADKALRRRAKGIRELTKFDDTSTIKHCRACLLPILRKEFGAHSSYCRQCMADRSVTYRIENPEAVNATRTKAAALRLERLQSAGIFRVTRRDLNRQWERQRGECPMCQTSLKKSAHVDHIVPVAKGGRHSIGNLQWLCGPCNIKKSDRFYVYVRGW